MGQGLAGSSRGFGRLAGGSEAVEFVASLGCVVLDVLSDGAWMLRQ